MQIREMIPQDRKSLRKLYLAVSYTHLTLPTIA